MLYTLRFRRRGVEEGFIEARDDATAEAVGQAFCAQQSARFMLIRRAILCDESILAEGDARPAVDEPLAAESLEEARNRARGGRQIPAVNDADAGNSALSGAASDEATTINETPASTRTRGAGRVGG